MEIYIDDRQSALVIDPDSVKAIVKDVISYEGQRCDEVGIHFVGTQEICELHEQFFDDPSPTDCISFPIDEDPSTPYRVLGDVFVCTDTAVSYAKAHRRDPHEEATLYLVHGLLHLMGYDDIDIEKRRKMRAAEKRHMRRRRKPGVRSQNKNKESGARSQESEWNSGV